MQIIAQEHRDSNSGWSAVYTNTRLQRPTWQQDRQLAMITLSMQRCILRDSRMGITHRHVGHIGVSRYTCLKMAQSKVNRF